MGNNRRTNGSANQKRSLGSRVGLQKATPPPRRAAQSASHPARPCRARSRHRSARKAS